MTLIRWLRQNNIWIPCGYFLINGLVRTHKVLDPLVLVADILWAPFGMTALLLIGLAWFDVRWWFAVYVALLLAGACYFSVWCLRWDIERLAELLHVTSQELSWFKRSELVATAHRRLGEFANELARVEQQTKPYAKERTEAKDSFERAYWFFLKHHLIEDVGYGRFFKR